MYLFFRIKFVYIFLSAFSLAITSFSFAKDLEIQRSFEDGYTYFFKIKSNHSVDAYVLEKEKWKTIGSGTLDLFPISAEEEKEFKSRKTPYWISEKNFWIKIDNKWHFIRHGLIIPLFEVANGDVVNVSVGRPFTYKENLYSLVSLNYANDSYSKSGTSLIRLSDGAHVKLNLIHHSEDNLPRPKIKDGIARFDEFIRLVDLDAFDLEAAYSPIGIKSTIEDRNHNESDVFENIENNFQDLRQLLSRTPEVTSEKDLQIIDGLVRSLQHKTRKSSVVLGPAGTGKTNLAHHLIRKLPRTWKVYGADAVSFSSNAEHVGITEGRVNAMLTASRRLPIVWIFDEMHALHGQGTHSNNPTDMIQLLKGPLARGELMVVGTDTAEEFFEAYGGDPALLSRFEQIEKEPLTSDEVRKALLNYIDFHNYPDINIATIERVMELSSMLNAAYAEPRRSIVLLEKLFDKYPNPTLKNVEGAAEALYHVPAFYFNTDKLRNLVSTLPELLDESVIGLDEVKSTFIRLFKRLYLGLHDGKGPGVSMLLNGPPGTGKTEFAINVARILGLPFLRVEMNKADGFHTTSEDIAKQITTALRKNQFTVILLDEIEKAPKSIVESLLAMFDSGILTTQQWVNSRKNSKVIASVPALNAIFIATSNEKMGLSIPFRSRIQTSLDVKPATQDDFKKIIQLHLKRRLSEVQEKKKVEISFSHRDLFIESIAAKYYEDHQQKKKIGFLNVAKDSTPVIDNREVIKAIIHEIDAVISDALLDPDFSKNQNIVLKYRKQGICEYTLVKNKS